MAKITVDNVEYEVAAGQNLLHACLSRGLELPYFCWHPSLGSVGACRQCAVIQYADEDDERGRLMMACMTPVADGARISIQATAASDFRASVIEWLMENHPHDCPVCEEGGECHLQDMTVMTGHTQRRYRGSKRTFDNQDLGPFLNHEMNRCITCYRCVRYYRDYAGGTDLQAFGSRDRMYFGRERDGVLENEFSGNLVEVCPTGVFTDKPFSRSYTRKWDLQSAPSICPGCAVGCNTFATERYGQLKRIHNRYHGELNRYFLCDRGRFGAGFVNSEERIVHVGQRVEDDLFEPLDRDLAIVRCAELIRAGGVVGVGSPRASLETNLALKRLVGNEQFCTGMNTAEENLVAAILDTYRATSATIASLADVEDADAVLILGEDLLNSAPRVALALRQTVRNRAFELAADAGIPQWQDAGVRSHAQGRANPLFSATLLPTRIDDIATAMHHDAPDALARCGFAIASAIAATGQTGDTVAETAGGESDFVRDATQALLAAERPLIISGTSSRSHALIEAAAAVVAALERAGRSTRVLLTAPEANSMGSGLLGGGLDLNTLLHRATQGGIQTLIVAENDLFRRALPAQVEEALGRVDNLVVLDALDTPTATQASLVFPAATFAESTGTFVNMEARAQRYYSVFNPAADVSPAWRWLAEVAVEAGHNDLGWAHVDDVLHSAAAEPGMANLPAVAVATSRRDLTAHGAAHGAPQKIPREPHRYSGRTAMNATANIHEPKTAADTETPLGFSMEGQQRDVPSALLPFVWAPGWNSNQSVFKFQQEVGGASSGGDPGVRLITGAPTGSYPRRSALPDEAPASANFRLVPMPLIFGSDEQSYRSPPIAERALAPYLVLNPADASRLGADDDAGIICTALGITFAVRLEPAMASGYAGITCGLGGVVELPAEPVTLLVDPDFQPPPSADAKASVGANLIARE